MGEPMSHRGTSSSDPSPATGSDGCAVGDVFDRPALWRYEAAAVLDVDVADLPAAMSPGPTFPAALRTAVASMPPDVGTVVDLGAGTGGASEWVRSSTGAAVIAVEPAPRARLVARLLFPELRVIDGSAERAPLVDHTADVVTLWGVSSLLDDLGPVLAEVVRLLRGDGLVVIADLVSSSDRSWHDAENCFRSIEAIELALLHAGFGIVSIGCGLETVDDEWRTVAHRIDAWIERHCSDRDGFTRWRDDKRKLASLSNEGAVLGAVLVAQRVDDDRSCRHGGAPDAVSRRRAPDPTTSVCWRGGVPTSHVDGGANDAQTSIDGQRPDNLPRTCSPDRFTPGR
jgi:SAM-dependent methyltransferase